MSKNSKLFIESLDEDDPVIPPKKSLSVDVYDKIEIKRKKKNFKKNLYIKNDVIKQKYS